MIANFEKKYIKNSGIKKQHCSLFLFYKNDKKRLTAVQFAYSLSVLSS